MKKVILSIALSLILLTNNIAQWEILNEGLNGRIETIDFVNENVGWLAGWAGTLLKTTDGGESWNSIPINESWYIRMIDFLNESIGWALGSTRSPDNFYIWKSSNEGISWTQQFSSSSVGFNSLYAVDENNVYAVGENKIYKTTNGGTNWNDISPNLPDNHYNSVWFLNSQTGVVTGYYSVGMGGFGRILRTTDGGASWNETIVNEFNDINSLQFLNSTIGYFRANNDSVSFLCKTEDMCSSWTEIIQSPYLIGPYQFLNRDTVYAIIGDSISSNIILKSIDGGANWQEFKSFAHYGPSFQLTNMFFNKIDVGFIIGRFGWFNNTSCIVPSNIGWRIQILSYQIKDVIFIDNDNGLLLGTDRSGIGVHGDWNGHIFLTSDGGKSWDVKFFTLGIMKSYEFVNESIGFSLTDNGIYKTTDSGNNWVQVNEWPGNDICFMDEENGFVVGRYGDSLSNGAGILKTTDTGETWDLGWQIPDTNNYEYNLKSIQFTATTGWTVGDGGMIVKYTSQTGWVKQTSITDLPLNKVFFFDENHGWIAGGYQTENDFQKIFLRTTNNGVNWNAVQDIPYLFRDIAFVDNNIGWAIGYDSSGVGGILKSTDGGNTWPIDTGNLSAQLNALHIKDNYGWAVGENGLILRTTNAAPTWVEDENKTLPTEFALEQNYPNPISAKGGSASGGNPSTKIRYTIPTPPLSSPLPKGRNESLSRTSFGMGFVSLRVYDILGREVATLVNEEQQPGVYEVEFPAKGGSASGRDGANLSSGIYLFRLQAGDYNGVKKMIFLK